MKKVVLICGFLALCSTAATADVDPDITFTAPTEGVYLRIDSTYTIRWTHNEYFGPNDTAHLFLNTDQIGDAPATQDWFSWTVGRRMDGSVVEPGTYYLDLEAADFQYTKTVNIHLFRLNFIDRLKVKKLGACPICYSLDASQLNLELAGLPQVEVELMHGGVVVARLGKFGPKLALPGPVKIELNEPASGRSPRPNLLAGYELRFLSPQGREIHRQAVQLEKTR